MEIKIKEYANNSKAHTDKQIKLLADMIIRFGWRQPILVNSKDNTIIAGHGRYMAYNTNREKIKTPWIINDKGETLSGFAEVKPLSQDEEKAYRHLDNLVNEMTTSDANVYIADIQDLKDVEVINLFDFTLEDLKSYNDVKEITLEKLEENKGNFNFVYPHNEYLDLLSKIENAIRTTGTETKEELLKHLLENY